MNIFRGGTPINDRPLMSLLEQVEPASPPTKSSSTTLRDDIYRKGNLYVYPTPQEVNQ